MKPIRSYSFEDIIQGKRVYVDKTDFLLKLIRSPDYCFILSRPRGFGKSLMLSTLKCIFEGRKELFEGLKIAQSDYDWKTSPVVTLDMSEVRTESVAAVKESLVALVAKAAERLSLPVELDESPGVTFGRFWSEIQLAGLKVAVLIDNYTAPMLGCLKDPEAFKTVSEMMMWFYTHLKSHEENIRFALLAGDVKVALTTALYGFNNPVDLTMCKRCAGILGYTSDELRTYFAGQVTAFAGKEGISPEEVVRNLVDRYGNYQFSSNSDIKVVNSASVGRALANWGFSSHWSAADEPPFVIEAIRRAKEIRERWGEFVEVAEYLDACAASEPAPISLLFQSGLLTIREVDGRILKLDIPNAEARSVVQEALAPAWRG